METEMQFDIDKSADYHYSEGTGRGDRVKKIFFSVLIGYAVTVAVTVIAAAALTKYGDPAKIYRIASLLASISGALTGGFAHAKAVKRGAILRGLETGAVNEVVVLARQNPRRRRVAKIARRVYRLRGADDPVARFNLHQLAT